MADNILHAGAAEPLQPGESVEKTAGTAIPAPILNGRLYVSSSGWLLLSVPNALVRGIFSALKEPGIELPTNDDGVLNAHVSVMRDTEVESLGGPDAISERGKSYAYQLGPLKTVTPNGYAGVSRVWYLTVNSPQLRELRRSYGLTSQPNGDWDFHITVAVRKKRVLSEGDVRKAAALLGMKSAAAKSAIFENLPNDLRFPVGYGLTGAALGAPLGIAAGAVRNMLTRKSPQGESDKKKKWPWWAHGLLGAAAGGVAGTGLGMMAGESWLSGADSVKDRLVANNPTKTVPVALADRLKRYYATAPGGLEKAISDAQEVIPGGEPYGLQSWSPEQLREPVDVTLVDAPSLGNSRGVIGTPGHIAGAFLGTPAGPHSTLVAAPGFDVSPGSAAGSVMEHELTHRTLHPPYGLPPFPRPWQYTNRTSLLPYGDKPRTSVITKVYDADKLPPRLGDLELPPDVKKVTVNETRAVPKSLWNYTTSPEELKAYAATVKRDYVRHTGQHVNTPETAEKAVRWWLQQPISKEKPEGSPIRYVFPSIIDGNKREKRVLLQQLMQIVQQHMGGAGGVEKTAVIGPTLRLLGSGMGRMARVVPSIGKFLGKGVSALPKIW